MTQSFVKFVLSLAVWTVILIGVLKLQNDYSLAKNILDFNEKSLQFDNNKTSTNKIEILNFNTTDAIIRTTIKLKSKLASITERKFCNVKRPYFPDLQFDNIYWQTLNLTNNGTIKLFRAFYDDRQQSKIGPSIRILAMINPLKIEHITTYCQLWFNKLKNPMISKNIEYKRIWHWGWDKLYAPFFITCTYNYNQYHEIPEAVSLVNKKCAQTENYLKILNNRPNINAGKKPFAVCLKDFNFNDQYKAILLIEWIELIRILGADKIFIYQFYATENIRKVFDYYEHYGIVEIVKITYPKAQSLKSEIYDNELISLNDCFYRNIYLYDYIAIFDVDEIIIPKHPDDMTWLDMLQRIKNNQKNNLSYDSYIFRNVYFLDNFHYNNLLDIPQYLYILQHVNRSICYTPLNYESTKSFYNTELVKIVYYHYPLYCLHNKEKCITLDVKTKFGHSAHYRQTPPDNRKKYCNSIVEDKTVWKYKVDLIKQVKKTANMLEVFKKL